jgi:hypothetical protein
MTRDSMETYWFRLQRSKGDVKYKTFHDYCLKINSKQL